MNKIIKEKIKNRHFDNVYSFILTNKKGTELKLCNFGAAIFDLKTIDQNGQIESIVLGYATIEEYIKNPVYMGATVGRYCNRIKEGKFSLDAKNYELPVNNGPNHLHGGIQAFDKKVWDYEVLDKSVVFSLLSPDNENGYPGNLQIKVSYSLTEENQVIIDFWAKSDQNTFVNLTNHSYFNLSGNRKDNILKHKLLINASAFTPIDENSIPTGAIQSIEGTPFDFRKLRVVEHSINSEDGQIQKGAGYDHNFVLNQCENRLAAQVIEPTSNRTLTIYATQPGLQFYSGNFLDSGLKGRNGTQIRNREGMALESQFFPDSPNQAHFPSALLKAEEEYSQQTIFEFGIHQQD